MIALHGWLDNAASFSWLAPDLSRCNVLALDLAGHGRSGYRPGGGAYNIWQDLPEILAVADAMGWDQFSVLGHSRGAMIGLLLAASFPERVKRLGLIDAVLPHCIPEQALPSQLGQALIDLKRSSERKRSYYQRYEDAAKARTRGAFPLSAAASELLASRAVTPSAKGYYWRYDPRLMVASEFKMSDAQAMAFLDALPREALLVLARDGIIPSELQDDASGWLCRHPRLRRRTLEGPHHLQLTDNPETMRTLAQEINAYFSE